MSLPVLCAVQDVPKKINLARDEAYSPGLVDLPGSPHELVQQ